MKVKPVLGGWEIPHIASIGSVEQRSFAELAVPGKTASLFQDLAATPTRIVIGGSLYGDEDRDAFLQEVRDKFRAGEPVTFVADIVTATEIQYVVIETLRFEQSAARPDEIEYLIALRESPPPPPPPGPRPSLDDGLLDEAGTFLDSVTGALGALDALGAPGLRRPDAAALGAIDGVTSALEGLGGVARPARRALRERTADCRRSSTSWSWPIGERGDVDERADRQPRRGRHGADLACVPSTGGDRRLRIGPRPAPASGRLARRRHRREARRDEGCSALRRVGRGRSGRRASRDRLLSFG